MLVVVLAAGILIGWVACFVWQDAQNEKRDTEVRTAIQREFYEDLFGEKKP